LAGKVGLPSLRAGFLVSYLGRSNYGYRKLQEVMGYDCLRNAKRAYRRPVTLAEGPSRSPIVEDGHNGGGPIGFGPGRPPKVKTGWLAKVVADMPSVIAEARADKLLQPKRVPGRPPKGATAAVTPKNLAGAAKKKRKYTRRAKNGAGRLKGKPGRPKGSGKVGRPKASGKASKGFLAGAVAKQIKPLLKAQTKALKDHVRALVVKEVKKALKAALR
jgi:hypothetical protein